MNQQTIANPIPGTIPKFVPRIPCQKSQVIAIEGSKFREARLEIVLVAGPLLSTRSREDRHAKRGDRLRAAGAPQPGASRAVPRRGSPKPSLLQE